MHKQIMYLLFSVQLVSTYVACVDQGQEYVSPLVESVSQRIYYVARLKNTIAAVKEIYYTGSPTSTELDDTFFETWKHFCQFRYITDKNFEILFLKRVATILSDQVQDESFSLKNLNKDMRGLLNLIDQLVDRLKNKYAPVCKKRFIDDDYLDVTTDMVAYRFYIVHRLEKIFEVFNELQSSLLFEDYDSSEKEDKKDPVKIGLQIVKQKCIKNMLINTVHQRNLKPLMMLWEEINQFKHLEKKDLFFDLLVSIIAIAQRTIQLHEGHYQESSASNVLNLVEILDHQIIDDNQHLLEHIDQITERLRVYTPQHPYKSSLLMKVVQWSVLPAVFLGLYAWRIG